VVMVVIVAGVIVAFVAVVVCIVLHNFANGLFRGGESLFVGISGGQVRVLPSGNLGGMRSGRGTRCSPGFVRRVKDTRRNEQGQTSEAQQISSLLEFDVAEARKESGSVRKLKAAVAAIVHETGVGESPLQVLHQTIAGCERCPRLREYCRGIGEVRRRAYRDEVYWARPVPGFGDPAARILVLGLAPGAHGANRTGRPFTGDGSGDFMYPVLHDLGLASGPKATSREDGLRLRNLWIGSVVRCAPPGDKPRPDEIRNCASHLAAELGALSKVRVVVCLGRIAWEGYLAHLFGAGVIERKSAFVFTHGAEYLLPNGLTLLGSYHPSLRNTNTGRLDRVMFARVFARAQELGRRR
jgi:uracil-DNA glycosylase family 4